MKNILEELKRCLGEEHLKAMMKQRLAKACCNCGRHCKMEDNKNDCSTWKPAEWLFVPTLFELDAVRQGKKGKNLL